jgi:hypothetical protein
LRRSFRGSGDGAEEEFLTGLTGLGIQIYGIFWRDEKREDQISKFSRFPNPEFLILGKDWGKPGRQENFGGMSGS